eukprot:scaffold770_cov255-Pinguiococcus_pyrenoidosus.AAC.26
MKASRRWKSLTFEDGCERDRKSRHKAVYRWIATFERHGKAFRKAGDSFGAGGEHRPGPQVRPRAIVLRRRLTLLTHVLCSALIARKRRRFCSAIEMTGRRMSGTRGVRLSGSAFTPSRAVLSAEKRRKRSGGAFSAPHGRLFEV